MAATATRYTYTVKTRDVDGSTRKVFKSFAGAAKRFEEMCGHTLQTVLDNMGEHPSGAKAEDVRYVEGVSNYGTVVTYTRKAKDELDIDAAAAAAEDHQAEVDLAQNPDAPEHQAEAPAAEPVLDVKALAKAQREAERKAKAEAKETEKAQRLAKAQADKKAREAVKRVKAGKVAPTHYLGRPAVQNGVKAPTREGAIATAWQLFDSANGPIYSAFLPKLAELHGLNLGNLQIEVNRWRKFNGIAAPGRMPKVEAKAAE